MYYVLKANLFKKGEMIYFSQLDLVRILERALRRAALPLYYTQGFRPHPRLSFGKAIKLGVDGKEEITFYFRQPVTETDFLLRLQKQLPAGLEIEIISPGKTNAPEDDF